MKDLDVTYERWVEEQAELAYYRMLDERDAKAVLERDYDPDEPRVDARTYPSAGTDEVECWRHPELPDIPWDAA